MSFTKNFRRCKNKGDYLFCSKHKYQKIVYPFYILTILGLTSGIFQDLIKPVIKFIEIKNGKTLENEPFAEHLGCYNVLILPFEPREDCTFKETTLEKTIRDRLLQLGEKENVDLNVKFATSQNCPATFNEGKSIGQSFNADMVIYGVITTRDVILIRLRRVLSMH